MNRVSNKKLLVITYYWPPCGGPGSIRPVKFAKYLPEYGFEPLILTCKKIAYHSIDQELDKDITGIKIYRTESFDPARILYLLGMRIYEPRKWQLPIKRSLNFPDNKTGWIPFAYNAGKGVEFDCIFVTAPPFSAFITGYLLSKKICKPLILDFRDAWLEFPFMPYKNKLQKEFVSYWEEKVVHCASLIIVVSEGIKAALISRYPEITKKIYVIPNGYDPTDFPEIASPEKFTISYLGTIRKERNPETFLKAVQNFLNENHLPPSKIEVKFIGHISREYLEMIKQYPFTKVFGHLAYHEALKEFGTAHLAFITTTGSEFFFASRQNEYLATGLPIISCGKSEGFFILKQAHDKGYPVKLFDYDDINGMKNEISNIHDDYIHDRIRKAPHPFPEYTRQNLAHKLAELIKEKLCAKQNMLNRRFDSNYKP
ncbi:MAG: glycosyltransferase [candidate division WOR-3 bacterium]